MQQCAVIKAREHGVWLHAVEVAENAKGHLVFFQELCKAAGLGKVAHGRVVEEHDSVFTVQLLCFFQAALYTQELFTK